MKVLVVDVGTSSVRASVVDEAGGVAHTRRQATPPSMPAPGLVELDPLTLADASRNVAEAALSAAGGRVDALAVTAQRSSAVVWDARDGRPLGPGLGWQDLRTVGECLSLQAEGIRLSPSEAATKYAWLLSQASASDPAIKDHARCGTVESWIAWNLSGGALHVSDPTNAAVTGLYSAREGSWKLDLAERLGLGEANLPRLVDTCSEVGVASVLPDQPPIVALVGDQQASLVGQGATSPGLAKATFGTGAMLDLCLGGRPPADEARSPGGCFPIVAWSLGGRLAWGLEAIMLAAGSAIEWLVEDLGILERASDSEALAASVEDTGGVVAVPALLGYGTPRWDFGARGAVFGLTRGTTRAHLTRAVLEGVAHSGADLLEAAEADSGLAIPSLRIDGGMSANSVFVQALADFSSRPVEVSPQLEATTVGAGLLGGVTLGVWESPEQLAGTWHPSAIFEPRDRPDERERWKAAVELASGWYPELSAISF